MLPLPYKDVLKYRTQQNVGGIFILVFNAKCTRECRPQFAACGTPDRAMDRACGRMWRYNLGSCAGYIDAAKSGGVMKQG
jgi:hypothetical protein